MRDWPAGVTETDLVTALKSGWDIEAGEIRYLPVGAGGYHWSADGRWFLTVTDARFGPLERALRTARALRDAGLTFVLAAVPAVDGSPLRPLGVRHNLSLFPLVDGESGDFGPHSADRAAVVDLIAALHRATPAADGLAPPVDLRLPGLDELNAALDDLGTPWTSGPYAEAARALLAAQAVAIGRRLAGLERLAAEIGGGPLVVTHGEPHPANILRTPGGPLLIDWDTVRIGPPERDLWHLTADPFAETSPDDEAMIRYAAATGHRVSSAALEFYRRMWELDDIAAYLSYLRRPHTPGGDAADALSELRGYLE